jgi:hypothetical protein
MIFIVRDISKPLYFAHGKRSQNISPANGFAVRELDCPHLASSG